VRVAIKTLTIPPTFITINLALADLKTEGSGFDLPIAVRILGAYGALRIDNVDLFLPSGSWDSMEACVLSPAYCLSPSSRERRTFPT
jgi:predicted ATPase with chaperone activity